VQAENAETTSDGVFLNVPYDLKFRDLFLAYIAGIAALGLKPRTTLEIPGGERRLDRIFGLIQTCRYSLHDLSRVETDAKPPNTPRFNMPFELGLAVAWQRIYPERHTWFVFERKKHRVEKSLSDLGGTDVYVHSGRPAGVFSELTNAFVNVGRQPNVRQMELIYQEIRSHVSPFMRDAGAETIFTARVFGGLRLLAGQVRNRYIR
jgi:hypothetical protein